MCQGLGTRQSDHLASHEQQVRRVPRLGTRQTDHCSPCAREKAHGELKHFAVCQNTGHTAKSSAAGPRVTKFAVCLPGGTRRSGKFRRVPTSWHTVKSSVTPLGRPHDINAFFFAVYPWIHTANWAFAVPSATVGGSPSATDGENFAVFLLRLCRVLGAHGELANSSSGGQALTFCRIYFSTFI